MDHPPSALNATLHWQTLGMMKASFHVLDFAEHSLCHALSLCAICICTIHNALAEMLLECPTLVLSRNLLQHLSMCHWMNGPPELIVSEFVHGKVDKQHLHWQVFDTTCHQPINMCLLWHHLTIAFLCMPLSAKFDNPQSSEVVSSEMSIICQSQSLHSFHQQQTKFLSSFQCWWCGENAESHIGGLKCHHRVFMVPVPSFWSTLLSPPTLVLSATSPLPFSAVTTSE